MSVDPGRCVSESAALRTQRNGQNQPIGNAKINDGTPVSPPAGGIETYVRGARGWTMTLSNSSVDVHLPLRPVEFEILLTLARGERHGYAILREIAERSEGAVELETGTMYRALRRLVEVGLTRPAARRVTRESNDERRIWRAARNERPFVLR